MEMIKGFKSGETVIEEGTKGTSAFIILSGTVGVLKRSGGKEVQLATLGQGQVFGEMGLIEDRPRSATVRALSEIRARVSAAFRIRFPPRLPGEAFCPEATPIVEQRPELLSTWAFENRFWLNPPRTWANGARNDSWLPTSTRSSKPRRRRSIP